MKIKISIILTLISVFCLPQLSYSQPNKLKEAKKNLICNTSESWILEKSSYNDSTCVNGEKLIFNKDMSLKVLKCKDKELISNTYEWKVELIEPDIRISFNNKTYEVKYISDIQIELIDISSDRNITNQKYIKK